MHVRVFEEKKRHIGESYGFLTIIDIHYEPRKYYGVCQCVCGSVKNVYLDALKRGRVKSCGCMTAKMKSEKMTIHGKADTLEYIRWLSMKSRCRQSDKAKEKYPHHAGKGITVCESWLNSFEKFYEDMGDCPEGYTLDRINNDLGYYKDNCRWVSYSTQLYNRDMGKQAGVNYREERGKWKAEIRANGLNVFLGYFENEDDAISARLQAEIKYFGEHPNEGKYVTN